MPLERACRVLLVASLIAIVERGVSFLYVRGPVLLGNISTP